MPMIATAFPINEWYTDEVNDVGMQTAYLSKYAV
jgi:hypothetical protein